jgi:hypothetical protein
MNMHLGTGDIPDDYLDLEDDFESLPPIESAAPDMAAARTSFGGSSRSAAPVQDYLPNIDVVIYQQILVAAMALRSRIETHGSRS